jgi:outer membrane protein OmpA-like peptidoglycan-associated protein
MEPRFGHDFSNVRVHADEKAAESARAINASAYAVGQNIVFGALQYSPDKANGAKVLAHELTHVVQQRETNRNEAAEEGKLSGLIMRKEREPAPALDPNKQAKSWSYPDDPTGYVAAIYFDTNSSEFDMDADIALHKVKTLLHGYTPTSVTFIGYADKVGGDSESNQMLSEQRANEVAAKFDPSILPPTVEVTGRGARGPEPTANNAIKLSRYRRVDVIIKPPKTTTPPEGMKGSGSKYGSEELKKGVANAVDALNTTLGSLRYAQLGLPSEETSTALERYFPQSRYRSAEFTTVLAGEISHILAHIDSIFYQEIKDTKDLDQFCLNISKEVCEFLKKNKDEPGNAAFAFPFADPNHIVLLPGWYKNPNSASLLVHEATHVLLGLRGHPTEVPHRDPYAIQGFVAALGGLSAPESDRRYPARKP